MVKMKSFSFVIQLIDEINIKKAALPELVLYYVGITNAVKGGAILMLMLCESILRGNLRQSIKGYFCKV